MLNRPTRLFSARVLFFGLALVFAASATLQAFLAADMSEWWPAVLAVALGLAALGCLFTGIREVGDRERTRLP